ncbi:thioredoxin family protein [Natronogracilivirga saccharolytica]|nr:thioredoxin family protein [Natronogracilivirga saccharolytica]
MARTPSNMIELGSKAPDFTLPDPKGNLYSRDQVAGKHGLLVVFYCNHCPFVKHIREKFAEISAEYIEKGTGVVAINSNDIENYPDDAPERMAEDIETFGYRFPYLFDETQEVARRFDAACTPDFYLYDASLELVYRGQFDDSRPGNDEPVTGSDLKAAFDALLKGEKPSEDQKPSVGCNIKWKS